jgi:hypothetical protein
MASGEQIQNNREPTHETEQGGAGDQKTEAVPLRQSMVETNRAAPQNERYFNKFGNWVSFLTLLFVAAYTVITFAQWRSNHILTRSNCGRSARN